MVIRKSTIALSITQALLGGAFATSALAQTQPASEDSSLGVVTVTAQSRSQHCSRCRLPCKSLTPIRSTNWRRPIFPT